MKITIEDIETIMESLGEDGHAMFSRVVKSMEQQALLKQLQVSGRYQSLLFVTDDNDKLLVASRIDKLIVSAVLLVHAGGDRPEVECLSGTALEIQMDSLSDDGFKLVEEK